MVQKPTFYADYTKFESLGRNVIQVPSIYRQLALLENETNIENNMHV